MRAPPFNVADYLTDPETTESYINELRKENERLREALRCTETALEEELKQIRRELSE